MKIYHKNFFRILRCFILLLGLNGAALSLSQETDVGNVALTKEGKGIVLSVETCTQLALANNFDIQLLKYDALIARTQEGVAESIYDTLLEAEVRYGNDQSENTSQLLGAKTLTNDYDISLSKKLPTGTTVTLESNNNRTWTDSGFSTLNPNHDMSLGVKVEQELGKNFFGLQDRGNIKITRIDIENAELTSMDKIAADISHAQVAYWDLVQQDELVEDQEQLVDQAKRLLDIHQEKIENGLVEKPELLAAEANYKQAVNELLLAQNRRKTKENVLKLLLDIGDVDVHIMPEETFLLTHKDEQLTESMNHAFENRYDYQEARKTIEARNISLSMKTNNLWPEINLEASLTRNGVDDHFNQAFPQIFEEDNPDFSAALTFSMPLENTAARFQLKAAQLEKAKALVSLKLIERQIAIGIHDQVRLSNVLKQVAINQVSVADLQAQKLMEEEKRFNSGRSDTDTLIRFQKDLSQARIAAAAAKFNYYAAKVSLREAEGTLLKKYWEGEF